MPAGDGSIVINVNADDKEARKTLQGLQRDIEKTAKAVNTTSSKHSAIAEQLQEARNEAQRLEAELAKVNEQRASAAATMSENSPGRGRFAMIDPAEYEAARASYIQLGEEQARITGEIEAANKNVSTLDGQEKKVLSTLQQQTEQLRQQKERAGVIERALAQKAPIGQVSEAVNKVSASMKKSVGSILKWGFGIRSAFILIRRLRTAIIEGVKAFAEQDEETKNNINGLKASLNTLKVSWGAAFAPILNAVAPILQKLIAWLTAAANAVQMFFAALGGRSTYKKAIANNNALADSYGAAGGAAKEAQKDLLGFDEINKLNDNSGGGGGGGGGAPANQFSDEQIPDKFRKVIDFIKGNIFELETIVGDALLAIGAILLFTWTKPVLGLGMIAAGIAMKYNVAMNWDALPDAMRNEITLLDVILGSALLAIGAILAFSNTNLPLGLGLMAAGAVMLGSAVALNWDTIKNYVRNNVADILAVLGTALFAVGAIIALACPALLPLGIGLMAAGGISLLAGAGMGIDWDYVKDKVHNVIDKIKGYLDSLKQKWEEVKKSASDLKDRIVLKFNGIRDKIAETIEKIKEFFRFKWELPEIKLPHLTVAWEPLDGANPIARLFGIGSIPHLGINWYARGGIVDGATLIGAGEAGKEAIVPLERNTEWINLVADRLIDRITQSNRLADYISGMPLPAMVSGQIVPPRALSGGGSVFTDGDIERLVSGISAAFRGGDGAGEQVIRLYLDGRQIAETVTRHQRQQERGR